MVMRQEFNYKLWKFTALMKSFEKTHITACFHSHFEHRRCSRETQLYAMQKNKKIENDFV